MQHQDWETVVLRKPKPPPPKQISSQKPKIEKEGEEFNLPKIGQNLKLAIQQARLAKKMTQKQLADKLNVPVQEVAKYESGKTVPNHQFINRIERVLGVNLPRVVKKKLTTES